MADFPREPRNYELMVMLLPELADEALTSAIDTVSGYVTAVGADIREILQDSPWGRRRLAYTIRFNGTDYRDGYYAIWHFSTVPSSLTDLERDLKLDTNVIRHLLVIEDPKWGSPQERDAAREAANAPTEAERAAEEEAEQVAEAAVVEAVVEAQNEETLEVAEAVVDAADAVEAVEVVAAAEEAVAEPEAEAAPETGKTFANGIKGDGTDNVPDGYPIKGNANSMLYHVPGSAFYNRTIAEWYFASAEEAEAAGFQLPASQQGAALADAAVAAAKAAAEQADAE